MFRRWNHNYINNFATITAIESHSVLSCQKGCFCEPILETFLQISFQAIQGRLIKRTWNSFHYFQLVGKIITQKSQNKYRHISSDYRSMSKPSLMQSFPKQVVVWTTFLFQICSSVLMFRSDKESLVDITKTTVNSFWKISYSLF